MKRAATRRWILIVVVLALLAAAWWQFRSDRLAMPGTLLQIQPDVITRVTLQVGNAPAEHYVKRGEQWWSAETSTPARADDLRLGELVRIAAAPVQNWQPADSYDSAKIGLSPPQARLELDGQTLLFGGMTALGQNAYVRAGERIGIISLRYMPRSARSQHIKAQ